MSPDVPLHFACCQSGLDGDDGTDRPLLNAVFHRPDNRMESPAIAGGDLDAISPDGLGDAPDIRNIPGDGFFHQQMDPFVRACDRRIGRLAVRQKKGCEVDLLPGEELTKIRVAPDAEIPAEAVHQDLVVVERSDDAGLRTLFEQGHIPSGMQMAKTDNGHVQRMCLHLVFSCATDLIPGGSGMASASRMFC